MKTHDLLSKSKIDIIPVKHFDNGLVFYVKNGKGLLRAKYGTLNNKGLCALVFDDIPLIKFHGDEYLCPTCEKFISAGYGLNMCKDKEIEKLSEVFNAPFVNIKKSFDDLKPLLGLLPAGYYTISDEELFQPTGRATSFGMFLTIQFLIAQHAQYMTHEVLNGANQYRNILFPLNPLGCSMQKGWNIIAPGKIQEQLRFTLIFVVIYARFLTDTIKLPPLLLMVKRSNHL